MTPNEFQDKCKEVAFYPNKGNNLTYVVLGLAGETAEFNDEFILKIDDKNLKSEISDCQWYISQICSELKIDFQQVCELIEYRIEYRIVDRTFGETLVSLAGKICEITKKIQRDDDGIISEDKKSKIIDLLKQYYTCSSRCCTWMLNCTIEDIFQLNIDKLMSRKERNVLKGSGSNR